MEIKQLNRYLSAITNDKRVTVWHLSVYVAILHLWNKNNCVSPVQITRRKVMQHSHVGSIVTYHKCISELQEFGYIEYLPSYHPKLGSKVYLKTGQLC